MSDKQISPLNRNDFGFVQYDMPFFMATAYLYHNRRWMSPVWPIETDTPEELFSLGTEFHYHGHFEFIYVLEGTFTQHLENSVYRLNAGDATFLNSNIRHYEGDETECTCIYINFLPAFMQNLLFNDAGFTSCPQHQCSNIEQLYNDTVSSSPENRVSLDFRQTLHSRLTTNTQSPDNPRSIISEMISELSQHKSGYIFALQSLLLKLFTALETPELFHITRIYTHSSTEAILFADIQHYVTERYGRISRQELSSLLHYNSDYLGRIVKQQTGMSFLRYCQTVWIEKAKELLRTTDMKISDIIHYLNFENKTSFYHVFSEATGMTPAEYRQQYRENKKV